MEHRPVMELAHSAFLPGRLVGLTDDLRVPMWYVLDRTLSRP